MRDSIRLISAVAMAACAQTASGAGDWRCATIGVGAEPAPARAAAGFLERAVQIYPSQLLGVVQSGGRIYLVNARDDGWSERVRLGLMELRLAEPDITAARRFQVAASGVGVTEIPAGDYACVTRERAGRHGLALDEHGRMSLAPGKSVHLVDPREWSVVVEVKAVGTEPLDFREILALSGRSGIYAGLSGRSARPGGGGGGSVQGAGGVIEVAIGPSGRPDGAVVITPRAEESGERADSVVAATPGVPPAPAPAPVAVAPAVAAEPPARAAKADAPPAQPLQQISPAPSVVATVEPAATIVLPRASTAQPARPGATQSYDEYAKTMKTLLELRRSGSVRSVSEMTYVLPVIEDLRKSH
jgi:hypothetical protein